MNSICILTDSTAQFTKPSFPGRNFVHVVSLNVTLDSQLIPDNQEFKVGDLPVSAHRVPPHLHIPGVEEFRELYVKLAEDYRTIVAILVSSSLCAAVENAQRAADLVRGRVNVQVIDSQSTSVGLGFLVQMAAEAVENRASVVDVERLVRGVVPHIYSVYCIPGLSFLSNAGFIDHSQALVGEMLGIMPIFSFEEGRLSPLEKARNSRHLVDFFQEFIDEFSDLYHISLIQSIPALQHEGKALREHALANFPRTPFSEHPINLSLAALIGPRSIGVIAIEIPE
jgi:DegV family protein with EDD domain